MKIAIVGLRHCGKTTLFNAITGGVAEVGSYSSSLKPNIGVRKVTDSRLDVLARLTKSARIVPAEVNITDVAYMAKETQDKSGLPPEVLGYLTTAEALLQVIRYFEDDSVPHPLQSVDPLRDIASFDMELAFSDLGIIERRLQRLSDQIKSARTLDRPPLQAEEALLNEIKVNLENDVPIRQQTFTHDQKKILSSYQFLTAKPILLVANLGEDQIGRAGEIEAELQNLYPQFTILSMCAKLEMELLELSDEDAAEFRSALGATAGSVERVVTACLSSLGLISFLTTGPDETRAWTIQRGTLAPHAAGKVHSDIEKGFIRAEVITYDDFAECQNEHEARKRGLLRLEGKDYVVQDGDVVNFLFNV
ncbi:MAG: redox-regulated ATPase YchF [Dehalococcoidia bacterium]|nr:redox-regulated ATPase YchF [Dehalococcoidia bacterium]